MPTDKEKRDEEMSPEEKKSRDSRLRKNMEHTDKNAEEGIGEDKDNEEEPMEDEYE
jgi:hypothetical protein